MSEELKAALARIAYLEGEISKRDARILELESQYQRDVYGLNNEGDPIGGDPAGGYANDNARLRAELAAIKAQEPVAWAGAIEYGVPLLMVEPQNWKATPLYAAPVSEVKAQGVVMPERWNVPRPMWKDARQPYGNPLNHADIEAAEKFNLALDEVARLNAAPVQRPKCKTCDDNGRIGGPSFYAPDEGGYPCPDCCAPVQQVSVPAGLAAEIERAAKFVEAVRGCERLASSYCGTLDGVEEHGGDDHEDPTCAIWHRLYYAMFDGDKVIAELRQLAAAQAAPAADAGLVDMYRHLQTVTPYRFKKIQDASVTDGGDVLYFHKDRFDAALLDDMAANCAKESK